MTKQDFDKEDPPSYEDVANGDSNEMMQPTILILAGQTIHAESADSAPLYRVNRGVASLTRATVEVEFERLERRIRDENGEPVMRQRSRQIYDLLQARHPLGPRQDMPLESPRYYIKAASKRTGGNLGLKKSLFRNHWKSLPVDVTGKNSMFALPQFIKDEKPMFETRLKGDRYEWTDGEGNAIAVEDMADDQHRLIITAPMPRYTMDALVAMWCCRLWEYSAAHAPKIHEGMEGGKRS